MKELVFFLEGDAEKEMLDGILPRILPKNFFYTPITFEGKSDMEKRLTKKIRGYNNPNAFFVVLRDQDAGDCIKIKKSLQEKCIEAGRKHFLIRIACHELESWYLADLSAVEKGLNIKGLTDKQNQKLLRTPDKYPNPLNTLEKIAPSYQKISGSRAISQYMDLDNHRSNSFKVFIQGIKKICSELSS